MHDLGLIALPIYAMHPQLPIQLLALMSGLVLLVGGAEFLVKGATNLARHFGINPLVIGLTIVAFGTSAPELGVSLTAAFLGKSDLSLGNVVGSNIANTCMVLGLGAAIRPVEVRMRLLRIEVPLLIGASVVIWACGLWGYITRSTGLIFFVSFAAYCWLLYAKSHEEACGIRIEFGKEIDGKNALGLDLALVLAGLVGLVAGSKLLVWGAVALAHSIGISELTIGLTLTAVGTSLPEMATTISAARRRQGDLILGNVVGSNLANILGVLGITAIFRPLAVSSMALNRDIPVMVGLSVVMLIIMKTGKTISRKEGAILLFLYGIYVLDLYVQHS